MQSKKFINVQILRALAAALVVYVHAISTYETKIGTVGWNLEADLGDIGVKLFFCISGFIIFNSTYRLQGGLHSSLDFLIKRCVRILPLYWVATTIYSVKLLLQGNPPTIENFVRSLLFIPYAASGGLMRPVLGQGWTLNFEMVFYALAGLFLLSRSRLRYYGLIASLAIAVLMNQWLPVAGTASFFDISLVTTELLFFFISGIAVGMVVGNSNSLPAQPFGGLSPLLVALVALALAATALSLLNSAGFESVLFWMEWVCCTFAVFAATLPGTDMKKALPLPAQLAAAAGDGSYSTYLLHGFIMGPAARLVSLSGLDMPLQAFALLMVVICSVAGVVCCRYFELPVQQALYKAWRLKPKSAQLPDLRRKA
ncbi:MAG: hypothetical protein JWR74_253 [Polaromonas sp.]|nr:hypothetical protein [Polaromonas sp.]